MVDYSTWLDSIRDATRSFPHAGLIERLVILLVCCLVLILLRSVREVPSKCSAIVGNLALVITYLMIAYAIFTPQINAWMQDDPNTLPKGMVSFTERTERVFAIDALKCDGECPVKKLPADRTKASWMRNGRLIEGTIIVQDNKVGLADGSGNLLKPVDHSGKE